MRFTARNHRPKQSYSVLVGMISVTPYQDVEGPCRSSCSGPRHPDYNLRTQAPPRPQEGHASSSSLSWQVEETFERAARKLLHTNNWIKRLLATVIINRPFSETTLVILYGCACSRTDMDGANNTLVTRTIKWTDSLIIVKRKFNYE